MSDSKQLVVPDDEPWMSHAFVSKIAAQVSLPYRRPKAREIVKRNGDLEVRFICGADCLPYGKYPRLFELWACTMIKSRNECWNPETMTLSIGKSFRDFLELLNVNVGGKSLRTIKPQLESLFKCAYIISYNTKTNSKGANFTVAETYNIDWLRDKPLHEPGTFENWVTLSKGYVQMLEDHPVPIDLKIAARFKSPMSLDIYWWLTKRYYRMHDRVSITWRQLYDQFGSDSKDMFKFRQNFKEAVAEVTAAYPQARITCGREFVTLYPSETSVPTVSQARRTEKSAEQRREAEEGHWTAVAGYGEVYTTTELFDVTAARDHFDGTVEAGECRYCRYDARNREHHASNAGTLF
jgi:hypothetical protein